MKITTQTRRVNPQRELLASFDLEDQLCNATSAIEEVLARLRRLAQDEGFETVRVLCESTGGYERALLQRARRLDCRTALVKPEHGCRLKKVESNSRRQD